MKIRRRNFKRDHETPNFWPSFTDVMSTIALVLFFNVISIYTKYGYRNKLLHNIAKLEEKELELKNVEYELAIQKAELEKVRTEAERIGNDLAISQRKLTNSVK